MMLQKLAAAAAATVLIAAATGASAQAAIPGACVLDQNGVLGGSAVGKYVGTRLKQLEAQVTAEIQAEGTALQTDAKTLDSQHATLPASQYDQRAAALQARDRDLQRKIQVRQRELQATEQKALERISVEVDPIVRSVATQHGCALLFNQSALILPAPTMDVTSAVVQQLDAKIQQFPFDREHLDQATGAPAQ